MLRPRDLLVFGDISTFGLNRESMTRNIPLVLKPTRKANPILSMINAIQFGRSLLFSTTERTRIQPPAGETTHPTPTTTTHNQDRQ